MCSKELILYGKQKQTVNFWLVKRRDESSSFNKMDPYHGYFLYFRHIKSENALSNSMLWCFWVQSF